MPFCGCGATCYAPSPGLEIICPKHYRLVDRALKARRRRLRVALQRHGKAGTWHEDFIMGALWSRIRAQAIERAAGAAL